jgi:hypothetical protein
MVPRTITASSFRELKPVNGQLSFDSDILNPNHGNVFTIPVTMSQEGQEVTTFDVSMNVRAYVQPACLKTESQPFPLKNFSELS